MAGSSRTFRRPALTAGVLIPLAVALLVVLLVREDLPGSGILRRLELASLDYRFSSRGAVAIAAESAHVVIVEIDERSFAALPDHWPWPRSYYARAVRNLKAAGARVVGIDLLFGGRDAHDPAHDDTLRAALREADCVVLAGKGSIPSGLYLHQTSTENFGNVFFGAESSLGLVNIRNDADGVYRRYAPFFVTGRDARVPSFGFALLNRFYGFPPGTVAGQSEDGFVYAGRSIPAYDAGTFLINYAGPAGTFRHIAFADVIDDETFTTTDETASGEETNTFSDPDYGYLSDGTFRDKIVLIGSTVPEDHDLFPVSWARGREAGGGDNLMYGVEIHAHAVESVLRKDFLRRPPEPAEALLIVSLVFLTFHAGSALKRSRSRRHALVELTGVFFTLLLLAGVGAAALMLFRSHNLVLGVTGPAAAVLGGYVSSTAYHFITERKQRMLLKSMFSTYLNPKVVDELIADPARLKLGGDRRELTVLFSDIEGFTTIAERLEPEALVALLNGYLSRMAGIVLEHGGTLDKYEGDAIMAFWGAPVPLERHALQACRTALRMQEAASVLGREWQEAGHPPLRVRIGINTGSMVVGNLGGASKFDYTVIGDSVNLASRLEGANKLYGTGIILSEGTYLRVRDEMPGRELDLLMVRGRAEPVRIYELLTGRPAADPDRFLELFAEGLRLYRGRLWEEAAARFREALRIRPEDTVSELYVRRSLERAAHPPPADWAGVHTVTGL
ncbi:MAG: adenylate/guanylate cyclase domain-containing protein [Bacteroidota bacterium]